ncbi:MAG: hypothetical protein IPP15_05590 [Saprospiraceae bacterium]|uniref:Cytochrome c domain-containing protein n=1 Tax=Candidatus Opimibacter skivensis TaxID=2982028 RepID=A0A9D7STA6_9BACT|nr:hypothetical protein [Candidatus Opimibacter skivensis]
MNRKIHSIISVVCLIVLVACNNNDLTNPGTEKYFPQVKTIIENHCASCHNSSGSWAGRPVSFDDDAAIAMQYQLIKAAVADPISPTNRRMPQDGMLTADEIDIIVKWFDKGGKISD